MREGEDKLFDKLVDMIDAHAKTWNETCELQEFIKEIRKRCKRRYRGKVNIYIDAESENEAEDLVIKMLSGTEIMSRMWEVREIELIECGDK